MKLLHSSFWQSLFNKKQSGVSCGISIQLDVVRIVKLQRQQDGIACTVTRELPYAKEDQLPMILGKAIEEYKLHECVTSIVLPPNRIQNSQIEKAELPAHDIQKSLPWQCKDLFSIPPQDMICDYIDMSLQPAGQSTKAHIFATSKSYLEMITTPFHQKGAQLGTITSEQFALAQLQTSKDSAQLAFIQHQNADGILAIVKNKQICFARKLRGMNAIIDMTPEQLEAGGVDNLAIELQRSIDFYESQLKQPPIKNAVLAIAGDNADAIIKAVNVTLPVRAKAFLVDSLINSELITQSLLTPLGAALPSLRVQREEAKVEA